MRLPLLIAGILISLGIQAQTPGHSQQFKVQQAADKRQNYLTIDPSGTISSKINEDDPLRLIIRLKASPLLNSQGRVRADNLKKEHQQFTDDVYRLSGNSASARAASTIIRHEYSYTFNGFAITTTKAVADEIKRLPYVASVSTDEKVTTSDTESNGVIHAPQAWQNFGVTGKNVRIGIIDTGIDYNHPDLGQGLGSSYKVTGGYDFVNNDNDPMDDHGHGTHVAGIAAANGTALKGVAPDAKLVAYKVLSSDGYGYDSWILAAIERCTDPDQNPATDDALDVVNMSLGRNADPNEPLSEAVNNAIAKGIVFSIAAGNNYDYLTIGTPGVAKDAITVGATNNYKQTANFSSKGPTEKTFLIKPEVSAPGVDINSSFPNQTYKILSGTSMASPHVAGAAALLLEKNPHWTPEMIKCSLMGTARSVSPLLWDQGAGVIDIHEALKTHFIASPGAINFGMVDSSSPWTKTSTLTITNTGSDTRSFALTTEGGITQAPFTVTLTPASFSLDANASREVQVSITAHSEIAIRNLPDAYTGSVNITSNASVVKTPIALLNPQRTLINFTGELPYTVIVMGIEGSGYWKPYNPTTSSMELFLPKAKYDFITHYWGNRTVITEAVNTEQNVNLTLDRSLAKNLIVFKPLDKEGNPIHLQEYSFGSAFFSGNERNIFTWYTGIVDSIYVSDQGHYKYEFKYHGKSPSSANEYYDVVAETDYGILENEVCSNDPGAFGNITIRNPGIPEASKQHMTFYTKSGGPWAWSTSWNSYPIELPGTFSLIQTQHSLTSGYLGSFLALSPLPQQPGYVWETSDIRAEEGNAISFYEHINRKIVTVDQQDLDYALGRTIPNFILTPSHEDTVIRYSTFLGRGAFNRGLGERERGTVYYKLYNGGSLLKEGNFHQAIYTQTESVMPSIGVTPGTYQLDFEYSDFQTGGKFGKAKVSTVFNTSEWDKNPPVLKNIRLLVNGNDTNEFQEGESGSIQFSITDVCDGYYYYCSSSGLKTPTLKIKQADDLEWASVSVHDVGNGNFSADLPSSLNPGYYLLQLTSGDNSGNKLIYEVTPAFLIGPRHEQEIYTAINLIEPKNLSINAGTNPLFRWSALEGASYVFQLADNANFTGNVLEEVTTEAKYILANPLEANKTYYWRVRPAENNTHGKGSVIFKFESRLLPPAGLLSPANHSAVDFSPVNFAWSAAKNAFSYTLEVSRTVDFSQMEQIQWTGATNLSLYGLYSNTLYYWRVKSSFFSGWETEQSVSDIFDFTTGTLSGVVLLKPFNQAIDQPGNVTFEWSAVDNADYYIFELSKTENFNVIEVQQTLQDTVFVSGDLPLFTTYYWRITAVNESYTMSSGVFTFKTGTPTAISELSGEHSIYNFPNPFNKGTDFVIQSETYAAATMRIVDQLGQEIKSFSLRLLQGENVMHWDGRTNSGNESASGLYFVILNKQDQPPVVIRLAKME